MYTSYNINSISIQHRYSVIIPGIGSSDWAGPYRAGKPRNWSTSRTSHDDFFEFLSSHSFRASSIILLTLSWKPAYGSYPPNVWRIWNKQDCREVILLFIKRRQQGSQKTTATQKFTSSSTKNGAIKKAWTRLSRRAGARFCNEDKVYKSMCVITKYIVSRLIAWQRLASKTPWPMNCIVQQNNWATNTTFNEKNTCKS